MCISLQSVIETCSIWPQSRDFPSVCHLTFGLAFHQGQNHEEERSSKMEDAMGLHSFHEKMVTRRPKPLHEF